MKNNFLILLFLMSVFTLDAQTLYPYNFSKLNEPYTYLNSPTSLTTGSFWDDTVVAAPIGFNFKFLSDTNSSDSVFFSTWGFLAFRNEYYPSPLIWMGRSMVPFASDMLAKSDSSSVSTSDISYQTTGVAGSRIFKLQCKNIGFYDDTVGTDSLNFQIWLYETSNKIEYHYGPSNTSPNSWYWNEGGPRIGLYYDVSIDTNTVEYFVNNCTLVVGDSNTAHDSILSTTFSFFNEIPDRAFKHAPGNGQVFRFAPKTTIAVHDIEDPFAAVQVFPIAFEDMIHIHHAGQIEKIVLSDLQGRKIMSVSKPSQNYLLSVYDLPKGVYLLTMYDNQHQMKTFQLLH